jgi:hypothetical protein
MDRDYITCWPPTLDGGQEDDCVGGGDCDDFDVKRSQACGRYDRCAGRRC